MAPRKVEHSRPSTIIQTRYVILCKSTLMNKMVKRLHKCSRVRQDRMKLIASMHRITQYALFVEMMGIPLSYKLANSIKALATMK